MGHGDGATARAANDPPAPTREAATDGEDVGARAEHPLRQIGAMMIGVRAKLRGRDTSQETQATQQKIIDGLSKLIETQQQQSSSSSSSAAAVEDRRDESGDEQQQHRPSTGEQPTATNGSAAAQDTDDSAARARRLFQQIWGQLPDQVRQQIETPLHETFLPQYDDVIQDYFRRLANEKPR